MQRARALLLGAFFLLTATGGQAQQRSLPPYEMGILRIAAIQKELNLTPTQKLHMTSALDAALRDLQRFSRHGVSMAAYDRIYGEQLKALNTFTEPQRSRLRQISLQMFAPYALTDPGVAKLIGLSEAERHKIQLALNTQAQRNESQMRTNEKALRKSTVAEAAAARQGVLSAQRRDLVKVGESMLTSRQRARWKSMLGRPFDLDLLVPKPQRVPD